MDTQAQIDALNARVTALEQQASTPSVAPAPDSAPDVLLPGELKKYEGATWQGTLQAKPGTVELITARDSHGQNLNPGPYAKMTVTAMNGEVIASSDNGSTNENSYHKLVLTGLAAGGTYRLKVERNAPGSCYVQYV